MLAITTGLAGIKYRQISAAIAFAQSFPEASETVKSARVSKATYRQSKRVMGEIVATKSVELVAEYAGVITEVNFDPGAEVSPGQVLLRLDTREEKSQLNGVKARAELAQKTLTRNESLNKKNLLSAQATDQARADLRIAMADASRLNVVIDKKTLRAPFHGRASLHEWHVGQFIQAGSTVTELVGISDTLWADFSVPQDVYAIGVEARVWISTAGLPHEVEAQVVASEPNVATRSRMVKVRAALQTQGAMFLPGAIINVRYEFGPKIDVASVPATALKRDAFGLHVFTLTPDEAQPDRAFRAHRVEVDVVAIDNELAYIRSALPTGSLVAADGAFKLREGLLVFTAPIPQSVSES